MRRNPPRGKFITTDMSDERSRNAMGMEWGWGVYEKNLSTEMVRPRKLFIYYFAHSTGLMWRG